MSAVNRQATGVSHAHTKQAAHYKLITTPQCATGFAYAAPYAVVVVVLLSVVNEETALVSLPHKAAA